MRDRLTRPVSCWSLSNGAYVKDGGRVDFCGFEFRGRIPMRVWLDKKSRGRVVVVFKKPVGREIGK